MTLDVCKSIQSTTNAPFWVLSKVSYLATNRPLVVQARHTQRLEVAQRASRPQQEEELGWDDPDADNDHQHQPSAPVSPVSKPKQWPQAESPSAAPSSMQAPAAVAVEAAEGQGKEAGAVAPSVQAVPEAQEVTTGNGSSQGERPTDPRSEGQVNRAGPHTEGVQKPAVLATGDEDAAETVTSSDSGSGNEHWTVVKSPSKQSNAERTSMLSRAGPSPGSPSNSAADAGKADQRKPAVSLSAAVSSKSSVLPADDSSEIDELDDVSNDGDLDAGNGAEEDWGSWE